MLQARIFKVANMSFNAMREIQISTKFFYGTCIHYVSTAE